VTRASDTAAFLQGPTENGVAVSGDPCMLMVQSWDTTTGTSSDWSWRYNVLTPLNQVAGC
jgi:hypothetical protein